MAHDLLVSGLLLVGVLISVEVQDVNALICRVCKNALYLDDCREVQTCLENEHCCTEEIVTPNLQIIFNGGCRSSSQINTTLHGGVLACNRCCNTPGNASYTECNSNLCGLKSRTMLHQCFQCGGNEYARQGAVADGTRCQTISACNDEQTCFVSTINNAGIIKHKFGCAQKLRCFYDCWSHLHSHLVWKEQCQRCSLTCKSYYCL